MNVIISWLCKIILKLPVDSFLVKDVKGKDNIPKKGNFIVAANHQSHLDHIATGYVCVPRKYHYLGQTDRYHGFTKAFLYTLYFIFGVITVNREKQDSRRKAAEKSIEVVKKGACLVIYPEGTRSRSGEIQEGKCGVAKIYLKTGVPILPVGIKGTFELMPAGKAFPKIKREVEINIGKPLYFEKEFFEAKKLDENSKEHENLCQNITDKVMEEIAQLAGKNNNASGDISHYVRNIK